MEKFFIYKACGDAERKLVQSPIEIDIKIQIRSERGTEIYTWAKWIVDINLCNHLDSILMQIQSAEIKIEIKQNLLFHRAAKLGQSPAYRGEQYKPKPIRLNGSVLAHHEHTKMNVTWPASNLRVCKTYVRVVLLWLWGGSAHGSAQIRQSMSIFASRPLNQK